MNTLYYDCMVFFFQSRSASNVPFLNKHSMQLNYMLYHYSHLTTSCSRAFASYLICCTPYINTQFYQLSCRQFTFKSAIEKLVCLSNAPYKFVAPYTFRQHYSQYFVKQCSVLDSKLQNFCGASNSLYCFRTFLIAGQHLKFKKIYFENKKTNF